MENLESGSGPFSRFAVPRAIPSSRFAQDLGQEIRRAAQQKIDSMRGTPLSDVVIELRRLIYLLRRTLVPVHPPAAFTVLLGGELRAEAAAWYVTRTQRRRWLMLGGVVGSLLSLLGVVAAVLVRRHNDHHGQAKKAVRP